MVSWKTTVAGICAILTVVIAAVMQFVNGGFGAITWEALFVGVIAGVGLILGKDFNVSNAPAPGSAQVVKPPGT